MARPAAFALCIALALGACAEEDYRVVVRFADESLASRTDRIELALTGSCDDVTAGQPPPDGARRLEVTPGDQPPAFGEVEPGRAGLYGRALDEDGCAVIAAGCTSVELEEGGGGTLLVVLDAVSGLGCPPGSMCEDGACVPIPDPEDEAWIDALCLNEGETCGDGFTGFGGICYETDIGLRCCGGCYDDFADRCEAGDAHDACGWQGLECDRCDDDQVCLRLDRIRTCR